jgi:hypothetical protein
MLGGSPVTTAWRILGLWMDNSRWEIHNQIDYILIYRRRHSSVLDVKSFKAADCDTDQYLLVAKVEGRQAENKKRSDRFHIERFNLKKLNEAEGKEK